MILACVVRIWQSPSDKCTHLHATCRFVETKRNKPVCQVRMQMLHPISRTLLVSFAVSIFPCKLAHCMDWRKKQTAEVGDCVFSSKCHFTLIWNESRMKDNISDAWLLCLPVNSKVHCLVKDWTRHVFSVEMPCCHLSIWITEFLIPSSCQQHLHCFLQQPTPEGSFAVAKGHFRQQEA